MPQTDADERVKSNPLNDLFCSPEFMKKIFETRSTLELDKLFASFATPGLERLLFVVAQVLQERLHQEEELLRQRQAMIVEALKPFSSKPSVSLKGIKIAPKYQLDEQHVWSGRGKTPRWLAEFEKKGGKRATLLVTAKQGSQE